MKIIEATLDQLDETSTLFEQYRLFYKLDPAPKASRTFIRERLLAKDSDIFLAYDDESTCTGFIQTYRTWDSISMTQLLFLYDLFVVPEFRNQKIGDQLMDRVKELAAAIGAGMIMLQTHKHNNEYARRFYELNGFELDTDFDVYNFTVPAP